MTFEIEIGGRVRVVTVSTVAESASSGGRVRVRVQDGGVATGDPVDPASISEYDVDARGTDRGLSFVYGAEARSVDAIVTRHGRGTYTVDLTRVSLTATVGGRRGRSDRVLEDNGTGDQRVVAPLPGRIVKLLVAPGDTVQARQDLVVIEAMKMENALPAVRAGRVREVLVSEGASVEAGRLLLVIVPVDAPHSSEAPPLE